MIFGLNNQCNTYKQQAIEYLVPTAKEKMRAAKSDLTKKTENGGIVSIDSYVVFPILNFAKDLLGRFGRFLCGFE